MFRLGERSRGILGVVDGVRPKGVEDETTHRKKLIWLIGDNAQRTAHRRPRCVGGFTPSQYAPSALRVSLGG